MKGHLEGTTTHEPTETHAKSPATDNSNRTSTEFLPKTVNLFSDAGGIDHGFQIESFRLRFVLDMSPSHLRPQRRNFKNAISIAADLTKLGSHGIMAQLETILRPGESIGVIGGPPCQGFSRANTHSATSDPRNKLPILYLEIVEALQERYSVEFVLFENVLGIRD